MVKTIARLIVLRIFSQAIKKKQSFHKTAGKKKQPKPLIISFVIDI